MTGDQAQVIESYVGWWADAGLADAVSDQPCRWLAPETAPHRDAAPAAARIAATPAPAHAAPVGLIRAAPPAAPPADLSVFDRWLAEAPDLPGARWSLRRTLPSGPVAAPLMLLADVPDAADIEGGRLFSGETGRLLDAMLAAIGLTADRCRIAAIAATRPVGGRLEGAEAAALAALARHHVAIARPRVLLLLGRQSARLIERQSISDAPHQEGFNHDGASMAAFAIHHPRQLIEHPARKRAAWQVLKRVRELIDQ